MKSCGYCGRENDDAAISCCECGMSFTTEAPGKLVDAWYWTPKSGLGLAFTSGLALLLICTSVFYTIGRVMHDIMRAYYGTDMGVLGSYSAVIFIHPAVTWTLFSLGALIFIFVVCYNRCQNELHSIITTIITLAIIPLVTFGPYLVPSLSWCESLVPVVQIGMITRLSAGYYVGAALQICVGVWLLGWFGKRTPPSTALEPTATAP